eukprot:6207651-Pleurochrysis_carterae.AAC.4
MRGATSCRSVHSCANGGGPPSLALASTGCTRNASPWRRRPPRAPQALASPRSLSASLAHSPPQRVAAPQTWRSTPRVPQRRRRAPPQPAAAASPPQPTRARATRAPTPPPPPHAAPRPLRLRPPPSAPPPSLHQPPRVNAVPNGAAQRSSLADGSRRTKPRHRAHSDSRALHVAWRRGVPPVAPSRETAPNVRSQRTMHRPSPRSPHSRATQSRRCRRCRRRRRRRHHGRRYLPQPRLRAAHASRARLTRRAASLATRARAAPRPPRCARRHRHPATRAEHCVVHHAALRAGSHAASHADGRLPSRRDPRRSAPHPRPALPARPRRAARACRAGRAADRRQRRARRDRARARRAAAHTPTRATPRDAARSMRTPSRAEARGARATPGTSRVTCMPRGRGLCAIQTWGCARRRQCNTRRLELGEHDTGVRRGEGKH